MSKNKLDYILIFLVVFCFTAVNGQTDGQVITRTNGGASWEDSEGNGIYSGSGDLPSTVDVKQASYDMTFTNSGGDFKVDTTTFIVDAIENRVGMGTTTPTSTLHVNGSFAASIRHFPSSSSDSDTDLDEDDYYLTITGIDATVDIPNPSNCPGRIYIVSHLGQGRTFTYDKGIRIPGSNTTQDTFSGVIMIIASNVNGQWHQVL
jgi:hypothetical protein